MNDRMNPFRAIALIAHVVEIERYCVAGGAPADQMVAYHASLRDVATWVALTGLLHTDLHRAFYGN